MKTPSRRLFDRIEGVTLENITKIYGESVAVEKLSLKVAGGELLMLIGPSGSGKTTTLKMINSLIEPDEGKIFVNGMDIAQFDPVLLRRNIGYVIQEVGLFPHMTVEENIGLLPKLEGWTEQQIRDKVNELLQLVSLLPEVFKRRYPRELSGGQQQRVGLARALALDAPLLLMDEPFGALDPILRRQLQNEFLRIKKELHRTIIFVTHDIEEAFTLGDRIAIMNEAKLIQVGEPHELLLHPVDDFVVDMVDAKRKYKHIDSLSVKDMMIALEEKYMFSASMSVRDAREEMTKRDVELAIVVEKSRLVGCIVFKDLLTDKMIMIGDIAKQPMIFEINHPMASALEEFKKNNQYIAIVVEEQMPVGLLLSNEILQRMV